MILHNQSHANTYYHTIHFLLVHLFFYSSFLVFWEKHHLLYIPFPELILKIHHNENRWPHTDCITFTQNKNYTKPYFYALITNYFIFQNAKLNKFTRTILHRMDTTRKEIIDVRKQCDAVNQDASAFRAETSKVRLLNHLIYL